MRAWLRVASWSLALLVIGLLVVETHRLAESLGRAEVAQRELQQRLATAAAAAPPPTVAVDAVAHAELRLELETTRQQLAAVTATLAQRNEQMARRQEQERELAQRRAPMPEGVRACLQALHEWLRSEGFANQRFLGAGSLEADGLHEVELLDTSADGLEVAFVQAARMTATLDRVTGQLELRFFDGTRSVGGQAAPLPEPGLPLRFCDIDGHRLEARLPFLVQAVGSYPAPSPASVLPHTNLDGFTRRQWLERLDLVLGDAGMDLRWRATRLVGMDGGRFLDVDLVGTDTKRHVIATAHAAKLAIEVDRTAGVVSLLLQDGSLRREGVESTITAEGLRMLLPDLTPQKATDAMFGMVVTR
ncbi:MAG: hypothetical protein JNN13_08795 [Planctomycetes bacterium]|nr:hypothetical protein [Planctomycetota bacterium]